VFERFTTTARTTVVLAQEEARRLGHRQISTPHLLLALLHPAATTGEPDDAGVSEVLQGYGITPETVGAQIHTLFDRTPRTDLDDTEVLAALGIDMTQIRAAVEANFGPGALDRPLNDDLDRQRGLLHRLLRRRTTHRRYGHIPFSPGAKKALELSLREAIRLHDRSITSDHLLLGLLRGDDGATAILERLGVDRAALRTDLERRHRRSA